MRLNTKLQVIVDSLQNKLPDVHGDIILLEVISKLSHIASFNRLEVQNIEATTFCNVYTVLFAPSGVGKDKPLKLIDRQLFTNFENSFKDAVTQYQQDAYTEAEKYAKINFETKSQIDSYIKQNEPRNIQFAYSNATLEGLYAEREALQKAGFGGTYLKISEIGDYIKSDNTSRAEFLTGLMELFDSGDNLAKIIKGDKNARAVKGVPSTAHMHGSMHGMIEGRGADKLKEFLGRGLARRSLIAYPRFTDKKIDNMDKEYQKYLKAKNNNDFELAKEYINEFLKNTNKVVYTEEANRAFFEYMFLNKNENNKDLEEAIKAEKQNRHWKALKISGLIARLEHPNDDYVTIQDLETAISIVEYFGSHLERFYELKEETSAMKMFKYFVQNEGKEISKMELRNQKFVNDNQFSYWFNDVWQELVAFAKSKGYQLLIKKGSGNAVTYSLYSLKSEIINQAKRLGLNENFKQILENNE